MMTKNLSPIVVGRTRTMRDLHPGYRNSNWSSHTDFILLAGGCLAAYLLVVYFFIPGFSSHEYTRATAELSYYWQNVWEMKQYQWRVEYYPYIQSVLSFLASFL